MKDFDAAAVSMHMEKVTSSKDAATNQPKPMHVAAVQIPVYVHVKEVVDPSSRRRTALEVNYMKFLAYNGSYKLFGFLPAGDLVCTQDPGLASLHDVLFVRRQVLVMEYEGCVFFQICINLQH